MLSTPHSFVRANRIHYDYVVTSLVADGDGDEGAKQLDDGNFVIYNDRNFVIINDRWRWCSSWEKNRWLRSSALDAAAAADVSKVAQLLSAPARVVLRKCERPT